MKTFVWVFFALFALSCPAFGAAGGSVLGNPNMGDSISFPDLSTSWNWNNYGESGSGSFWVGLYGHTVEYAHWNFYVFPDDTSQFSMHLNLSGWLSDNGPGFEQERHQNSYVSHGGMEVSKYLYLENNTGEESHVYVSGGFSLSPAELTCANFSYNEFDYSEFDVPEDTFWMANYQFQGHFIAPTLEEAQAMGAQFASVPEPSCIAMMLSLLVFGGSLIFRNRR